MTVKIKISLDDPETRAVWESALAAKREVESWPAWKRGEPVWENKLVEESVPTKKPARKSPLPSREQVRALRKAGLTSVRKTPGVASRSTMADVKRAKAAFDEQRSRNEAVGMEVCMVVVGYVSGREPFRLLGRVSADTGFEAMPDPPLTDAEMQPVAFAAKMAFAKVLRARRRAK